MGWLVFQDDRYGSLRDIRGGARRLSQVVLGASRLVQMAVPAALDPKDELKRTTVAKWKEDLYGTMQRQAGLLCGLLDRCPGLRVIFPEGGEYLLENYCHVGCVLAQVRAS